MDAADLIVEYARRHDACRATRDPHPLGALFGEDAEMLFCGTAFPALRGRPAIERAFAGAAPDDDLVLGSVVGAGGGCAHAVYGWRREPELVAGALWLTARDGRIARLEIVALPGGPTRPTERRAVRAIVVAPGPKALLVRTRETHHDSTRAARSWWITPGGGVDPGESDVHALRRELAEEVGLEDASPSECVWKREHVFTWNDRAVRQRERFHVVRVPEAVAPRPRFDAEQLAAEGLDAWRWWSVEKLLAERDEVFAPRRLPQLLAALLLADAPPGEPIDVGI